MPLRARHTSFMQTSETYMIIVACPCSQPGNFIQRTHLRQNSQNRNTPEPCEATASGGHLTSIEKTD
jgi:hypothetical protein